MPVGSEIKESRRRALDDEKVQIDLQVILIHVKMGGADPLVISLNCIFESHGDIF